MHLLNAAAIKSERDNDHRFIGIARGPRSIPGRIERAKAGPGWGPPYATGIPLSVLSAPSLYAVIHTQTVNSKWLNNGKPG